MKDPLEDKTKVCLCAIGSLILVVRYNIALFQSLETTTEFYTVYHPNSLYRQLQEPDETIMKSS